MITKEYTKLFFNKHKTENIFMYTKCDNTGIPLGLCIVEFKNCLFKFQKLNKLNKVAKQKEFGCWCPFYHIDKFWLNIRKEKLIKINAESEIT